MLILVITTEHEAPCDSQAWSYPRKQLEKTTYDNVKFRKKSPSMYQPSKYKPPKHVTQKTLR